LSGLLDQIAAAAVPGRRRLAAWARTEPTLAGLGYSELTRLLWDDTPPIDYDRKDRLLAALVRLAHTDQAAALLLVACLLPGVKARLRSHGHGVARDDSVAVMVGCLWRRVAHYPLDRRPTKIAANLLGDTLGDFIDWRDREHAWTDHTAPTDDDPTDGLVEAGGSVSPTLMWHDAQRAGVLSDGEVTLIDVTRLVGVPLPVAAQHLHISHGAARKRRRRAELRWAPWWTTEGAA
jgi:hypothetical protein